jgi:hypothetical protein
VEKTTSGEHFWPAALASNFSLGLITTRLFGQALSHCDELETCREMIFAVNYKISMNNLLLIFCQIVFYTNFIYYSN